jgi:hypothetical protein
LRFLDIRETLKRSEAKQRENFVTFFVWTRWSFCTPSEKKHSANLLSALPTCSRRSTGIASQRAAGESKGFLVGVNGATFIPKEHYDLFFPPEEWLDSTKIASSILDYIEKNKEFIKSTTPARKVMVSWYLANHPKSGDREKALAESLLKD